MKKQKNYSNKKICNYINRLDLVKELSKLNISVKKQLEIFIKKTNRHRATFYRDRKKFDIIDIRTHSTPFKYTGKDLGNCYFCFKKAKHIHHINKNRKDNTKENLLPLCRSCHSKLHRIMANFESELKKAM